MHLDGPPRRPAGGEPVAGPAGRTVPLAPERHALADPQLRFLRDHLLARLDERHTLEDLAALFGLDRFASCVSSKKTGMTPHAWLKRLRLEQGKRLLGSGLPVSEVALAVGFFDQSHFTTVSSGLRAHPAGVSPADAARLNRRRCNLLQSPVPVLPHAVTSIPLSEVFYVPSLFLTLGLVHLVALASPGPDFALILRTSLQGHRPRAALGIALAILLHATLSLTGIQPADRKPALALSRRETGGCPLSGLAGLGATLAAWQGSGDLALRAGGEAAGLACKG